MIKHLNFLINAYENNIYLDETEFIISTNSAYSLNTGFQFIVIVIYFINY